MATRAQQFEVLAAGVLYNGSPLSTGYVRFYAAGTTTLKDAYADKDKSVSMTKVALDAQGRAEAYGDGIYKLAFYEGDPDAGGVARGDLDNQKVTAVVGNSRTVTADDTVTRDDFMVLVDTSAGNITLSFADVNLFDNFVVIKKIAAANTLTLDPSGAQTIDGSTTLTMTSENHNVILIPDTSADVWRKAGDYATSLLNLTASVTELNQLDDVTVGGTTAGDIVTIDATQILTNKTLTSPALNTGVSGTAVLDEDNMASNSATQLATQQSIKAYVDSGTVTMTNKTLTSPALNTGVSGTAVLDEDNMASNSATQLATQQSIKAYVDSGTVTMTNKTLTNPKINEDVALAATATALDAAATFIGNLTAIAAEVNTACDGIGVDIPRSKILSIGTWNMDSTGAKNVAHGLTLSKIRGWTGYVINDAGDTYYPIPFGSALFVSSVNSTNIVLTRAESETFDSNAFDYTTGDYNRGYLTVHYID